MVWASLLCWLQGHWIYLLGFFSLYQTTGSFQFLILISFAAVTHFTLWCSISLRTISELVSRWPIGEPTSQPYIVGANDLICSRYSHIFDIESNQYNHSLLFFIGNNHSFICSINIERLWWSGYCDRSIFKMQCPTHWSDLNGGSFRHLGRQAFWLLSSHINSMDIDSAYLKKIVMEFDFYCEKNNIFRLI